jgi:hypothetical protein
MKETTAAGDPNVARLKGVAGREKGSTALSIVLMLVVALAVGIGAFLAYQSWTGDERVVKKRLGELAEILSPPEGGDLAMIGRIVQLRGYFAPDVHIRFGREEIDSRDALVALLGRWQPPAKGFSLQFVDVVVHLVTDDTAHVSLTAEIANREGAPHEAILDAREGTLTMKKLDGDWVIAIAETTETLQR